ncbi:MAG: tetratricopeptide repeat protein [Bacteroidia bacterium]
MKLRIALFLLFISAMGTKLVAQDDLDKFQNLADDFYKSANYSSAIDVYERLLFFGNDSRSRKIYLPLARAYTATGQYERASINYNNAYNNQSVDTLRYEILFESALNYLLANDTALAYSELLNVPETKISSRISNKLHLLIGTLDYKTERYKRAKTHFLAISTLDSADKKYINTFFKKTKRVNQKYNPVMVEWMSLVPGLGQAWCGYYEESANAFILTSAFVALYLDVTMKYRVLDGLLTVYPWFNRYYKGGVVKSYKLAIKKRETERNKLFNALMKSLPPIN